MPHFASVARLFLWSTTLALYHARYKGALDESQYSFEPHLAATLRRATSWQPPPAQLMFQDCSVENGSSPARSHVAGHSPCRCSWVGRISLWPWAKSLPAAGREGEWWHRAVEGKRVPWEGASGRPKGFCYVVEQDCYFTSALIFSLLLYQMVKHRLA